MNELINVTLNENQEPVVSGRQLHQVLGVKTAISALIRLLKLQVKGNCILLISC